jgi:carboxylate-amine ligase
LPPIARRLLEPPPPPESEDIYITYNYNRFQACRFGLEGQLIDGATGAVRPVHQEVLATLEQVRPLARELGSLAAMDEIERWVRSDGNDARWQREIYQGHHSMAELVLCSAERFRGAPGTIHAPPVPERRVDPL